MCGGGRSPCGVFVLFSLFFFLVCFLSVVKDLQALQVEHLFTALFRSSLVYTFQDFIYRFIQARVTTKGQKVGL